MNYNLLLDTELQGVYGDYAAKIAQINRWYSIYDGDQEWQVAGDLDYEPTQKITNIIKKLIDTRARFMFGREPFFDVRPINMDDKGSTTHRDQAQEKEDLLKQILDANRFHSKALKAYKDCKIGGRIAIKLWADEEGLRIVFSPAQEFFPQYSIDDADRLEKVIFLYGTNVADDPKEQRITKQVWEMQNGRCILNETIHDGNGELIEVVYSDHDTKLDFIPVIIITNGGLTGETEGVSDVEELWSNQDTYNKLASDDVDALKFQMFGLNIAVDASEDSLANMIIAPGATIDLQTENSQAFEGRQAKMARLESNFTYSAKFEDTINRIKNDMYDTMDVPNVSLEQLRGLMQSGKSMKALYWGLMAACDEDWIEWGDAFTIMVEYIFKMVDVYNLYGARKIAKYETTLEIERYYPIQEDEDDQKKTDMEEVRAEVRSRRAYMDKWGNYEDIDSELEQIVEEKQMFDNYTRTMLESMAMDDIDDTGEEE